MKGLTDREREYLSKMPPWSDVTGGEIANRFDRLCEQYEFDVNIPIQDLREHVARLQEQLEKIRALASQL